MILAYAFDHPHDFADPGGIDDPHLRAQLGGKGLGLAKMSALGIPVPPGCTIPTAACRAYLDAGWSSDMAEAVRLGVQGIEAAVGKRFGDRSAPLLVSVRSGAAISMPGMMDTVLNVGMTADVARGLASLTGDHGFAWDTYRRAIVSFAQVVLGASPQLLADLGTRADTAASAGPAAGAPGVGPAEAEAAALAFAVSVAEAGYPTPADPLAQVDAAVEAVFGSWTSDRAIAYREREGIDHGIGTAATVQAMVFGNMGQRSGTGVAFSRNPSTGEVGLMGDFLRGAQGEDVVAGTHQTMPLDRLATLWPETWQELISIAAVLERHTADMVDLEFTVEDGRLWLLQTRRGKRSPAAAFRVAVEMANDPDFPVDRAEAVRRCAALLEDPPRVPVSRSDPADAGPDRRVVDEVVLATGLAASPGRVSGVVSFDPDDAVRREARGERVVLVREETSPADIHGMGASVGLVTTLGGMVSHAAVVARSWGVAAVVGCQGIELGVDSMIADGRVIEAGATITVCGDSGQVLLGDRPSPTQLLPEVETIRVWARSIEAETSPPSADAGSAAAVEADRAANAGEAAEAGQAGGAGPSTGTAAGPTPSVEDCLRLVVLKGMGSADGLVDPLGVEEATVAGWLNELAAIGLVADLGGGRSRATPEGIARIAELFEAERATSQVGSLCDGLLEGDFHAPNMLLKEVLKLWQIRIVDGTEVPNDHTDESYDRPVIDRVRHEVHGSMSPIIDRLRAALPRLGAYQRRLDVALGRLDSGDHRYMAHPLLDSYHTAWFELHEEMIRLAGRDRKSEAEAGRA